MAVQMPSSVFASICCKVSWLVAALLVMALPVLAQIAPAPTPPPAKVDQLIQLLSDPAVKEWLAGQVKSGATPPVAMEPAPQATGEMQRSTVSLALDRIKRHVERIAMAAPDLPRQFERARSITMLEFSDRGLLAVFLLIAVFIAAGIALAMLVFRLTVRFRRWLIALPRNTPRGRAKKIGSRILYSTLLIAAFSVGSAGVFLIFDWPPLLREIVLTYLTAAIVAWAAKMYLNATLVTSEMQVAHSQEVRVLPITDETADHWGWWLVVIISWFIFIGATFALLPTLGFTSDGVLTLAIPIGVSLLALVLAAVWRRPASRLDYDDRPRLLSRTAASWLLTAYFVLLFLIRTSGAFTLFWFAVAAFALPAAINLTHRAVNYVLRPPTLDPAEPERDAALTPADPASEGQLTQAEIDPALQPIPPVTVAVVDRAIRMVLILAAAYLLARVWGLDMSSMRNEDPTVTLILRAALNALVIVLAADFAWSIIKALIQRKLGGDAGAALGEEAHFVDPQQARLRTLLPIVQNIMFATISILAILMILSSIGIQIGPLIAGAGVVGVAIGFGAQTLVKDIISGVFYLLDDAFRVGEYITSGKYMGTVESFSLRSVKLRHHRGPLFTIPFGELGAVQNQSRDWVIDKFNITVGYDTDLEFARKLIKKIGLELAADPENAPYVIEPIKMQGVHKFGDYGIEIRMKTTTKPGQAFSMKRRFYVLINKAFKENGITIPGPTVRVHQDESIAEAAALSHAATRKAEAEAAAAAAKAAE